MSEHEPGATKAGFHCTVCGYDLSGSAVGGACPECGNPVSHSLRLGALPPTGMATASLVLGIVSIPGVFCYCLPGVVCGVLAIIFGRIARTRINAGVANASGRGMATAGLVCGIIATSISVLIMLGFVVFAIVDAMNN